MGLILKRGLIYDVELVLMAWREGFLLDALFDHSAGFVALWQWRIGME